MMKGEVLSWNRWPRVEHRQVLALHDRHAPLPVGEGSLLAHGNGRSYGDVCLNAGGTLLRTRGLDRFIAFDRVNGRLRCEAGVLLADILALTVPLGWFLPVTPGTRLVTVGGAVANDVHGKNHHQVGSFGHHVRCLELLRSSGERLLCSPESQGDWFAATVGGLGLTGLITWVELQLLPVSGPDMRVESHRFNDLAEFWALDRELAPRWPYSVSWIDCLAQGRCAGRGILSVAEHAPPLAGPLKKRSAKGSRRVPFDPPLSLVNPLTLRLFNALYYRQPLAEGPALSHYEPFFYPLDGLLDWNRIYGRAGFFQYQCVLPPAGAEAGVGELLARIARSGQGSFLAVLKRFGDSPPPGMLSFARAGATLALDFPNRGRRTLDLFAELDAVVSACGGALYPAKDARMSAAMFRQGFPRWEAFSAFIDPGFSSSFWRRVAQ